MKTESEVTAEGLFPFDGFEERLEIAFSEAFCPLSLNYFKKQGRPVLDGAGEYL